MSVDIQKILVPTDFSEPSQAVLSFATSLAKENDATLVIAHAVDLRQPGTSAPIAPAVPVAPLLVHDREGDRKQLEQVRPTDNQVRYEHRLVDGTPADAILQLIEEERIDLVIMGTHGRTGLTRLLMGSVAEAVVRRAVCPVLTLKPAAVKQVQSVDAPSNAEASEASVAPPLGPAKMHESLDPAGADGKEDAQQYLG